MHDKDWAQKGAGPDIFIPYRFRIEACVNIVAKLNPKSILDIGCATGHLAFLIKQRLPHTEIDGVDISPYALEKAKSIIKKIEMNIDAADLPLKDNSYDCVVCTEFLEHLYNPAHAMEEMFRVLRPGGSAVITTPNYALIHNRIASLLGRIPQTMNNEQHIRFYTYRSMSKLARDAGFMIAGQYGARRRFNALASLYMPLLSEWVILRIEKNG